MPFIVLVIMLEQTECYANVTKNQKKKKNHIRKNNYIFIRAIL